jgi:uncharacterized protein YcbX
MSDYEVSSLYVYPVKSLRGLALSRSKVDTFGFQYDRRFMLVDSAGRFVTQRKHPILARFRADFDGVCLTISSSCLLDQPLRFSVEEFVSQSEVTVWSDEVDALLISDVRTESLSSILGFKVFLAYMPDSSFRQVDPDYFSGRQSVSFADGFPLLLTNEASLEDLNGKLDSSVPMSRFRPNIVFKGDQAFQEDNWRRVAIGELEFELVKPCSRCVMTCVDEEGARHKEPLRTLATYRKNKYGVCFGQNMVQLSEGSIAVGDRLRVLSKHS